MPAPNSIKYTSGFEGQTGNWTICTKPLACVPIPFYLPMTFISMLAGCDYAVTHHGHNFAYLTADRDRSDQILQALSTGELHLCGSDREVSALHYVQKLCQTPEAMSCEDVATLTKAGWQDGEILEIVQVVAMFSYFVRAINGLGIQLGNEKPGLY